MIRFHALHGLRTLATLHNTAMLDPSHSARHLHLKGPGRVGSCSVLSVTAGFCRRVVCVCRVLLLRLPFNQKNDSVWRNTGHALRDRTERWNVLAVGRLPLAVSPMRSVGPRSRASPVRNLCSDCSTPDSRPTRTRDASLRLK